MMSPSYFEGSYHKFLRNYQMPTPIFGRQNMKFRAPNLYEIKSQNQSFFYWNPRSQARSLKIPRPLNIPAQNCPISPSPLYQVSCQTDISFIALYRYGKVDTAMPHLSYGMCTDSSHTQADEANNAPKVYWSKLIWVNSWSMHAHWMIH